MENVEEMEWDQLNDLDVPEGAEQSVLPHLVVKEIFKNSSSADCLNLSVVNKVWRNEALRVLRDRGSLTAKMNSADGRCKDLRAFASDLQRMKEVRKVIPFSGLTISISGADEKHGDWCEESSDGELDQIYEDILGQMDWKHLALVLRGHSVKGENCGGFQLVKKVLSSRSWSLEELSLKIKSDHEANRLCIQNSIQDCNFSSLRKIKFEGAVAFGNEDLIKALVSRAPNLKVLYTKGWVDLRANLLEGSAAVHEIHHLFFVIFCDEISERTVGGLRLRSARLEFAFNPEDFNVQRFTRMFRMFLQTSRTTLRSMRFSAMFLAPWMDYGMDLVNVRKLEVELSDSDVSQPRSRRLLKSFDFSRVFPNLNSVKISCPEENFPNLDRVWNALIDMVEQGNVPFIQPVNPTAKIKKLNLYWNGSFPDSLTRFLVEMFPDIKKLVIRARVSSLFVRCWDYWLNLKGLKLYFVPDVLENLDGAFCGIFPEEVAQLRERDEEYLRNVNIVPVMPSLSCLKRLNTLRIYFYKASWFNGGTTSLLSKVTGLVAFKRCPNLTVTLATNCDSWRQELLEMEPYASVQLP